MNSLFLLPVIPFLFTFLTLRSLASSGKYSDWRESFLQSSLLWGVCVTLVTEGLSFFHAFSFTSVFSAWVVLIVISGYFYYRYGDNRITFSPGTLLGIDPFDLVMIAGMVLLAGVIGFIAIKAPPNTWDSMTYHMSRVAHWIQNRSVAHYPTNNLRQLAAEPWCEFAIAHFQILTQGDRFANMIQWFSYIGCAIGVSSLAGLLGLPKRAQIIAAVLFMTIPMAILQGSGTQNDLTAAFWLVIFVYYLFQLRLKMNAIHIVCVGAALGLAILTKGVNYVYGFPFIVCYGLIYFLDRKGKLLPSDFKGWVVLSAIFLLINAGHYVRNYNLTGTVLGETGVIATNTSFGPRALLSNVIKSMGSHIGTPFTRVNQGLEKSIVGMHRLLGVSVDDPDTVFVSGTDYYLQGMNTNETTAGNLLHLLLIIICLITICFSSTLRSHKPLLVATGLLVFSFLFFTFLISWQHWISRLHLPLFVLWTPVIAYVLIKGFRSLLVKSVIVLLLFSSVYWLGYHYTRGLVGFMRPAGWPPTLFENSRNEQYFNDRSSAIKQAYFQAMDYIKEKKYKKIGMWFLGDDWEYPFWALINEKRTTPVRFEHMGISNLSKNIKRKPFHPDAVICPLMNLNEEKANFMISQYGPMQCFAMICVFGP